MIDTGMPKKAAALCASALLSVGLLAGCSAPAGNAENNEQAAGAESGQTEPEQLAPDSHLFQLVDQLASAVTPEQANELIGFEGEKTDEWQDRPDSAVFTYYVWDMGDDIVVKGNYVTHPATDYDDYAKYEADFPAELVRDRADFSRWSEIKPKLNSAEGLTYDQLVEYLGGVPGLRVKVGAGTSDDMYLWVNEDDGELRAYVDDEGECTMLSGWF